MFDEVRAQGYRQFKDLTVKSLGRVNLFVGKNNCGKSSLLEVLELLTATGPQTLVGICERRGEFQLADRRLASSGRLVSMSSLFGHLNSNLEGSFRLEGLDGDQRQVFEARLANEEDKRFIVVIEDGEEVERLDSDIGLHLGLTASGKTSWHRRIRLDEQANFPTRIPPHIKSEGALSSYIGTQRSEASVLSRLWDTVVLAGREELVLECLRVVNPSIVKVHFTRQAYDRGAGGIAILEKGRAAPVPLGSLGDGAKHLLTLSVHLAAAAGGVLLVDEIDTGLHFSTLRRIWELTLTAARELEIQVFSTTHSWDCIRALADAIETTGSTGEIFLHRLEGDTTTLYDSASIQLTTAEDIEVR